MSKNTSQSEPHNIPAGLVKVEIFSPTSSSSFHVHWIEIDSPSGFFMVGHGHQNTLSLLKQNGKLTYKSEENNHVSLIVPGGMAIIQNNVVKVLLFGTQVK